MFFCAETKGRSLEEIGRVFQSPLSPLAVGDWRSTFRRRSKSSHSVLAETHQTRSAGMSDKGVPKLDTFVDELEG
jgi:hypothetical protein